MAIASTDLSQNILNLKPAVKPSPQNEPYKLTFFVENDTTSIREMQVGDQPQYNNDKDTDISYDDIVVENYNRPVKMSKYSQSVTHEPSYCVLSAFLYIVTITTFSYLMMLWIKQKMYVQIEQLHWW